MYQTVKELEMKENKEMRTCCTEYPKRHFLRVWEDYLVEEVYTKQN